MRDNDDKLVVIGETGELCAHGPHITSGYRQDRGVLVACVAGMPIQKTGKAVRLVVMREHPAPSEDELRDSTSPTDPSHRPSRTAEAAAKS